MSELVLTVNRFFESPWSLSAFVALEEKQLPYRLNPIFVQGGDLQKPSYTAATGRVPSLRHGDYELAESSAIAEYLAETFPFPNNPRLFPVDLQKRGVCRMMQAWVRSDFQAIREERSSETIFYNRPVKTPLSATANKQLARLVKGLDGLITPGRPTLFESWCIADADLAMMLMRLISSGDPLPEKLKAYGEAAWQRPSIQKWVRFERAPMPAVVR